ncbi:MAG: hypothetical protein PVJ09_00760 [Candidatus Woesebacteria bacterium]|jgi:hypothetical protein
MPRRIELVSLADPRLKDLPLILQKNGEKIFVCYCGRPHKFDGREIESVFSRQGPSRVSLADIFVYWNPTVLLFLEELESADPAYMKIATTTMAFVSTLKEGLAAQR